MKKPVREINDNRILTLHQQNFLKKFASSELNKVFRLTGGTALSAFYLEHRLSEDLDFFSSEKIPLHSVEGFLNAMKDVIKEISLSKQFDRNIFSITMNDGTLLKAEFTYYSLKNLEETVIVHGALRIDGFLDIVVNKLCAIADRIDPKDYVDVYAAIKNSDLSLADLFRLAEKKCEVKGIGHVLKNRLLNIPEGIDRLPLKISITKKEIETFFKQQIKNMVDKEIK